MRRVLSLGALSALLIAGAFAPGASANGPQIEDPEGDHPVPWVDLTAVQLQLVPAKGGQVLEVTFTTSGPITPENRNMMTGYTFNATAGKGKGAKEKTCDLAVIYYAYPSATETLLPAGSAGASCGGKDLSPPFRVDDNTVTISVALRDLTDVGVGTVLSDLTAKTAPFEGFDGDDTGLLAETGDRASSDKSWKILPG